MEPFELKDWRIEWSFDSEGAGVICIDTPPGTPLVEEEAVIRTLVGALNSLLTANNAKPVCVGELVQFEQRGPQQVDLPFTEGN